MKNLLLIIPFIFILNCAAMFPCPRDEMVIMNNLGYPTIIPKGALDDEAYKVDPEYFDYLFDSTEEDRI